MISEVNSPKFANVTILYGSRGGSRAAATSKMERFLIIDNGLGSSDENY